MNKAKCLALIPARGGSKRIVKKNIKMFCGQPIISYPIRTSIESGCFDRVIVSTDDKEIAGIAEQHGAEVPFLRPVSLAGDFVPTIEVTRHAIKWCILNQVEVEFICCIYATSALLTVEILQESFAALSMRDDKDYAFPVCRYSHPIERSMRLRGDAGDTIMMSFPASEMARSQDLEDSYFDAGQFYWGRPAAFLRDDKVLSSPKSLPIVIPGDTAVDIDTLEDWDYAERLYTFSRMTKSG